MVQKRPFSSRRVRPEVPRRTPASAAASPRLRLMVDGELDTYLGDRRIKNIIPTIGGFYG